MGRFSGNRRRKKYVGKIRFSSEEYKWVLSLMNSRRDMLGDKKAELTELYRFCDDGSQRYLVKSLLNRFTFFNENSFNTELIQMARHIHGLNYPAEKTALVAMQMNKDADSSQEVLNIMKVVYYQSCKYPLTTINNFNEIHSCYKHGFRHFIVLDEFAGSGKTVMTRQRIFNGLHLPDATLDFCLVAATSDAINLAKVNGISLFTTCPLSKGITENYSGAELALRTGEMEVLESKLAPLVNVCKLSDHNFGYGRSEALYARKYGNIPNNVFPIMWWKADVKGNPRKVLFDRIQDGY